MRLQRLMRGIGGIGALCLFLASAAVAGAETPGAETPGGETHGGAWATERGVTPPGYAVTEPTGGNLNVDTVVLMCEELGGRRALQFELYPLEPGPLLPTGAGPQELRQDPVAEIAVDGRVFPARLMFADDHAVVTDSAKGRLPALSEGLLDALLRGQTLVIRFGLLATTAAASPAASFDSTVMVDLAAGHEAIRAVRRCAPPVGSPPVTH